MMSDALELRLGDSDGRKIWGGRKQTKAPSYTVKNLQADLKSVGVFTEKVDGG